jgi:ABC-type transporter MlaC component
VLFLAFQGESQAVSPSEDGRAPAAAAVRSFVDALSDVRGMQAAEGKRMQAVRTVLERHVDMDRAVERILGRYLDSMGPRQREDVVAGLSDYMTRRLATYLLGVSNRKIEVGPDAPVNMFGKDALVTAWIDTSTGSRTLLFRLSRDAGTPLITDVFFAGVSMIELMAAQAQSIMRREGVPALLATLAER